jgi:hypothetical protein
LAIPAAAPAHIHGGNMALDRKWILEHHAKLRASWLQQLELLENFFDVKFTLEFATQHLKTRIQFDAGW